MSAEKQKTILLVEDEVITAMAEKTALERYGYDVITVLTGEEAIETIEKTPAIDLILMDINLGKGMDGTEAAAMILRERDIPVVFLSSHMEPDVVAKTEKITSYGYVVKNSSITVLDASIKMAFKLFHAKINENKKEEELKKRNRYIESILDNMPIGFAVNTIDDGVARYLNDNFTKIYGWPKEVLTDVNQFFEKVYPGDYGRELKARVIRDMGSGDPKKMAWDDLKMTTSAGEHRYISARNIPILEQNLMVSTVWDTTQMHESQQALRESEERYRSILNASPDGIAITDIEGRLLMVSPAVLNIFAYERQEELLGHPFSDFIVAEDLERAAANVALMFQGTMTGPGEYLGLRANGSSFAIEVNGEFIRGAEGQPIQMVFIVRDISGRKRAEAALLESENKFRELVESHNDVIFSVDAVGRIQYISPAITRITGYTQEEVTGKNLFDFFGQEERERYAAQMQRTMEGGSSIGEFLITVKDRSSKWIRASSKCVVENGKIIGVRGIMSDITARWQNEKEKEQNMSLLRATLESTTDGILVISESGRITDFNQRFARMWHIPDSVLEEGDDAKTLHYVLEQLLDPQGFLGKVNELYAAPEKESFDQLQFKDGRCFERYSRPQLLSEKPVGRVWSFRDISELKLAESRREAALEALRESEEQFRTHYENSPLGLYRTTLDGRIQMANPALVKMLGYSSYADLKDRDLEKTGFEPSYPRAQFINKIEKDGEVNGMESVWKRNDGTTIIVRESARAVRDAQGKSLYYDGIVEDISELKRTETQMAAALEALKKNEEKYRELVENASDIVFRANKNGYFTFANPAAIRMIGYEKEELIGKLYLTLISPDMREKVYNLFVLQREKRIQNTYLEYLVLTKDGHNIWLGQNTQLIFENGQMTGFQAVARDITERKQAEAEIKRQLAEKEILLREVHHRIKNNIATIGGLISMRLQSVSNPEAVAVLQDAIGRVDSMSILYDKLLLSEGYKDIPVKTYVGSLATAVVALYPEQAKVKLEMRSADFQLDSKRLFPLGLIINELLTNTMKYAFINRKTGWIEITLTRVERHVTLTIEDNGIGLPAGFDINQTKGFGLMLVKMLSQQLGGSFSMETRKGTRCTIEFDI